MRSETLHIPIPEPEPADSNSASGSGSGAHTSSRIWISRPGHELGLYELHERFRNFSDWAGGMAR